MMAMYTVNATHAPITTHLPTSSLRDFGAPGPAPLRVAMLAVVVVVVMMTLVMVMVVMMLVWNARVLAEDERLDRHRHGE
jgi:hypothetical protein